MTLPRLTGRLVALTNAVTDLIVRVTDDDLRALGLEKGAGHAADEHPLLAGLEERGGVEECPGGGPANAAAWFATVHPQRATVVGAVGDDARGRAYAEDLRRRGVQAALRRGTGPGPAAASAVCWVLVTPDGVATTASRLGASRAPALAPDDLAGAGLLLTSGFELATNPDAVRDAVRAARRHGAAVALDAGHAWVVEAHGERIAALLPQVTALFVNEREALLLSHEEAAEDAARALADVVTVAVVKRGASGSLVASDGRLVAVPAVTPRTPVASTLGAGDAYAGGFLAGWFQGKEAEACGHMGSLLGARACEQLGGRPPHGGASRR